MSDKDMFQFAQMLKDGGYYTEAINTLERTRTFSENHRKIDKMIFEIYAEQKNCTNIAKHLSKAPNVCPVKILVSDMFDNPNSDKFVITKIKPWCSMYYKSAKVAFAAGSAVHVLKV